MKPNFIHARKETRKKPDWFLDNFLMNFTRSARLMHESLRLMHKDKEMVQEAKRGYLISLTSAIETFYHDLMVFLLGRDEQLLDNVLQTVKEKFPLFEIFSLTKKGISAAEIAASQLSYQSLREIELALNPAFPTKGYLHALALFKHLCAVPSRAKGPVNMRLKGDWKAEFAQLFINRHALVHDANLRCDITNIQMSTLETLLLQITQMTAAYVMRDEPKPKNALPMFFIVEDLIANDWIVDAPEEVLAKFESNNASA